MTQQPETSKKWIILPGTTVGGEVGTFSVDFTIWNQDRTRRRTLNGVVDTGASFTVVPDSILQELQVEPFDTRTFTLADGSKRDMALGLVQMGLAGNVVPVVVVFGPDPEKILLELWPWKPSAWLPTPNTGG